MTLDTAVYKVFSDQTLTTAGGSGSSAYSNVIDIGIVEQQIFKAQYEISGGGAGPIHFEVLESLNKVDYAKSSATGSRFGSALTSASGTGGDGKGILDISLSLARNIKFKAINENTTAAATISLWFSAR